MQTATEIRGVRDGNCLHAIQHRHQFKAATRLSASGLQAQRTLLVGPLSTAFGGELLKLLPSILQPASSLTDQHQAGPSCMGRCLPTADMPTQRKEQFSAELHT